MNEPYVIWSNEHRCWWGPDERGYCGKLENAGRYTREHALEICKRARGGRQFNHNPSEVPLLLADAEFFWGDDQEEWRVARARFETEDYDLDSTPEAAACGGGYSPYLP